MNTLWQMLSPMMDIRLPASGDILMNYRPWTNWGDVDPGAGDPEIEDEVFRHIAMPGKQLGKLSEAVMALIEVTESKHEDLAERPAIVDFRKMVGEISRKKEELQDSAEREARSSLRRLRSANPQAFDALVKEKYEEGKRKGNRKGNDA